ncbi:MAG: hypothetical protein HYU51_06110 [Candidatus Rokubacteria bacterium]|nr:hypothetical protein [Candidatus Rokubacteria bacterium]
MLGEFGGGAVYGNDTLLPLIGGSGGGGGGGTFGMKGGGGGGGGGALLIATSGTLTFSGQILAFGGAGGGLLYNSVAPGVGGGGSGGGVRLVATEIVGTGGVINVSGGIGTKFTSWGGTGASGRIRLEAFSNTAAIILVNHPATTSFGEPTSVRLPGEPTLRIASVAGVVAPDAPSALFSAPDIVLPSGTGSAVNVEVTASNIPAGTAVTVQVTGLTGAATSAAAPLSGTDTSSSATVPVAIPTNQPAVITAFVTYTLTAATGGPVFAGGEVVDRVRITAMAGGASRVAYVTRSGREIAAPASGVVR